MVIYPIMKLKENCNYNIIGCFFCLYPRKKNLSGFTLAETLITLVIVGIIAAITIPSLIAKYQEEQLKSQLKKSYSTLSNALNATIIDFGYIPNCWYHPPNSHGPEAYTSTECNVFIPEFLKKMNIAKYCQNKAMDNGCIPEYKTYTSEDVTAGCQTHFKKDFLNGSIPAWVLADGSILFSRDNNY